MTYREEYDREMAKLLAEGETEESIQEAANKARAAAWAWAESTGLLDPPGSPPRRP